MRHRILAGLQTKLKDVEHAVSTGRSMNAVHRFDMEDNGFPYRNKTRKILMNDGKFQMPERQKRPMANRRCERTGNHICEHNITSQQNE